MTAATISDQHTHVAIVGAGVTGLTAGFYLGLTWGIDDVAIYEARDAIGGNIATLRDQGFLVENGPNGFLDSVPETLQLATDLGLTPLRSNDAARRRYIAARGRLVLVPGGPFSFLRSPLLTLEGRLRVLCEPFGRKGPKVPPEDETVFSFAARRIGREAAQTLVDTMVKGVFAGDSTNLSLKSAFPKMAEMEKRYGSLTRALVDKVWKRRTGHTEAAPGGPAGPAGVLTSFPGGLADLTEALGGALDGRIHCGVAVRGLNRTRRGFALHTNRGRVTADKVLLAVPAPEAAGILSARLPAATELLRHIPQAPIVVVACAFPRSLVSHPLDGFGFLVPQRERSRLLGCLWTSSIFPNRSPADMVLLRSMVGGARDPEALGLSDAELLDTVLRELRGYIGALPDPARVWIFRYPDGISQYPPGHNHRLEALSKILSTMPGLYVAGNSYQGISVNLCVVQALAAAQRLAAADRSNLNHR